MELKVKCLTCCDIFALHLPFSRSFLFYWKTAVPSVSPKKDFKKTKRYQLHDRQLYSGGTFSFFWSILSDLFYYLSASSAVPVVYLSQEKTPLRAYFAIWFKRKANPDLLFIDVNCEIFKPYIAWSIHDSIRRLQQVNFEISIQSLTE